MPRIFARKDYPTDVCIRRLFNVPSQQTGNYCSKYTLEIVRTTKQLALKSSLCLLLLQEFFSAITASATIAYVRIFVCLFGWHSFLTP